jgi:hypothetical protein
MFRNPRSFYMDGERIEPRVRYIEKNCFESGEAVFRFRIRMFLGGSDPHPLVTSTYPDPSLLS